MKWLLVSMLVLTTAAAAQEPVLKGPTVSTAEPKTTLVDRDFNGRLRALETPPEESALDLLTLDDATKAKTRKVLVERATILDKVVIENLELIGQIHNAGQSGDKAEALRLFAEFAKKLDGLKSRGKLVDEIKSALPEADRERYAAMVKEYHEASIQDTMDEAKSRGERVTRREATGRVVLQAIGREIKRSYDRQVTSKTADYERMLASLGLRPEQESKIRKWVTDSFQQTKGNATPEQKRALFWKIYQELDASQRQELMKQYRAK